MDTPNPARDAADACWRARGPQVIGFDLGTDERTAVVWRMGNGSIIEFVDGPVLDFEPPTPPRIDFDALRFEIPPPPELPPTPPRIDFDALRFEIPPPPELPRTAAEVIARQRAAWDAYNQHRAKLREEAAAIRARVASDVAWSALEGTRERTPAEVARIRLMAILGRDRFALCNHRSRCRRAGITPPSRS